MSRFIRIVTLALALSATPACAVLTPKPEIVASAPSQQQQRAYVLIGAYALALEQAVPLLRDPQTPRSVKAALGKAEAAATPAVELVKVAAVAYGRAREGQTAAALSRAIADAEAPVAALTALVAKQK